MRFIAGEFLGLMGGIGIVYDTVWGAICTWLISIAIALFAIIGLITVVWFFVGGAFANRKKRGETSGQYWLRTGKLKE